MKSNETTTAGGPNRKILFIEAPYSYGAGKIVVGKYFPLGIGYLASYMRQNGYEARILQPDKDESFDADMARAMGEFEPGLMCVSVMTPSYPRAVSICEQLKENYACATVMGGHHVSAVGAEVLEQSPATNFAVVGEGEQTLLELAREAASPKPDYSRIDGLVWRDASGGVTANKSRELIKDLDALPFPARDLVDMSRFKVHSYIDFGKRTATMITSRGCPYKCMFCSSFLTMGAKYRYRSVENIVTEIKEIVRDYGIDHIVFEDDTMTLKKDRIRALCEAMIEMPDRPSWYGLSRVDTMSLELAKLMKRAGCRMVNFGIESGSQEILKKIGKRIDLKQAEEAVRACTKAGLRTQCTFIVGFPFDTDETMKLTYRTATRIGPTVAIFFPMTPYPGTRVYNEFMDPSFAPRDVSGWEKLTQTNNESGISVNPAFTGAQIRDIADRWNRKYFLRLRQILQIARSVSSPKEFIRIAKAAVYLIAAKWKK